MLIVGAGGYALHLWLTHGLQQLAYAPTPIDEYCQVQVRASPTAREMTPKVLPCRETGGIIKTSAITANSFEVDALGHVHELYLKKQQWLLSQIVIDNADGLSTTVPLSSIAQDLQTALRPSVLLGLPTVE